MIFVERGSAIGLSFEMSVLGRIISNFGGAIFIPAATMLVTQPVGNSTAADALTWT
jgi:hypothetical protein